MRKNIFNFSVLLVMAFYTNLAFANVSSVEDIFYNYINTTIGNDNDLSGFYQLDATDANDYNNYFFIDEDDFWITGLETTIALPVKAHFDNAVSAWDIHITLPEGLSWDGDATPGADMKLSYYDEYGNNCTYEPYFNTPQINRFVGVSFKLGYYQVGGNWIDYGVAKWLPNDYNEMFIIYLKVEDNFMGGDITINADIACGRDDRPDVEPIPKNYTSETVCHVTADRKIIFADANVKALCVQNWDTNGDGELNTIEAAAVKNLNGVFRNKRTITSFNELKYFSGLTYLGFEEFYNCSGLQSIIIPNTVKTIGQRAFYNCGGLASVTIPKSVTSICQGAFNNCSGLQSVFCYAEIPPVMESSDCFTCYNTATLFVPFQYVSIYKNTDYWKNFYQIYGVDAEGNVLATGITLNETSKLLNVNQAFLLTATVAPEIATNKTVTWSSSDTSIASVDSEGLVTAISPGTVDITATTTDGTNLSATCRITVVQLVSSISLNKTSLSLVVNQTSQLTAAVYPSDATNPVLIWDSSDESIASVSSDGLVKAITEGTATITVTTTDGSNLSASCEVTVSIIPVTSLSLNKTSLTLDIDDTYQLTCTITPNNATYKTLSWTSSNPSVATVSSNGLVRPVSPGEVTITATTTDGTNLSASCQVTVVKRIKAITLNESSLTLTLPQTTQLVAFITPYDATNQTLTWTSSNTSVATVDANGFITSKAAGSTTIRANTTDGSNLSASCQVTVVKQYVTAITLNESSLVMHIGDTFQLAADVQPENASNPTLSWSTGNSSVARVDNNGLVTAIAGGTTYVRASATDGSGRSASCTIEVIPDYYITLDTLSHIRGEATRVVDLPVSLVNKNPISGIQFDVSLPSGVEFNLVDSVPDVWLDDARGTRSHSISASQLSNGKYRVLVTSATSRDLRGNDGVLVHMNMLLPQQHDTGNRYISITNIIASEADETRHTLDSKSTVVYFYYIVGDADANAVVDIADHAATASKILGKSPSPFYYDAANVDGNNSLDVADLVGITNIALEIRPITVRQAPRRGETENRLFCDKLNLNAGGEREITLGIDCGFAFAGFQMDVELPNGLTLTGATLGDDASALGLATEMMPDGKIRILGTSFSDSEVDGNCPRLLTLKVKAERNYMPGSEIEFADILFAERDMTTHAFDGLCIEYIEPSTVYELTEDARIYVENGNVIVDTPVAGMVQLIAIDGRMIEYQAHTGHNVFAVDATGIYIINFNGKTLKVRL